MLYVEHTVAILAYRLLDYSLVSSRAKHYIFKRLLLLLFVL